MLSQRVIGIGITHRKEQKAIKKGMESSAADSLRKLLDNLPQPAGSKKESTGRAKKVFNGQNVTQLLAIGYWAERPIKAHCQSVKQLYRFGESCAGLISPGSNALPEHGLPFVWSQF